MEIQASVLRGFISTLRVRPFWIRLWGTGFRRRSVLHSKKTPGFSFRSLTVILIAGIAVSCSLEAKKSRLLERADRYFKSGDYDDAKIEYLNLLRADHENATAFQQLGLIWFEEGAPLRAGPYLLKVRELSPNNLENRIRLTRVFIMVGQVAQAKEEALTVLQQSPASGEAIVLLAEAARTKEDIDSVGEQLQRFPARDSAFFHLASATLSLRRGDFASV
jgi:tetratricopeptide (TPR) repeat protein